MFQTFRIKRLSLIQSWFHRKRNWKLHGHAWDTTARYYVVKTCKVLIPFGFQGWTRIATQAKVEERAVRHYTLWPRCWSFLTKVWEWKDEYATTIQGTMNWRWDSRLLSQSVSSWQRFVKAVRKVFVELYKKRLDLPWWFIINWDPAARAAFLISRWWDAEVASTTWTTCWKMAHALWWRSSSWDYVLGTLPLRCPEDPPETWLVKRLLQSYADSNRWWWTRRPKVWYRCRENHAYSGNRRPWLVNVT